MSPRSISLTCLLLISIRLSGQVPQDSLRARLVAYLVPLASSDNFNQALSSRNSAWFWNAQTLKNDVVDMSTTMQLKTRKLE